MSRIINPNFTILHESFHNGKRGAILEGSSRCFASDQLIITSKGYKKISEINVNDLVLSFNHNTNKDEYKKVRSCIKQKNSKKCYRIKMKDGTIIKCTEDHNFFYNGEYTEINKILKEWKTRYGK